MSILFRNVLTAKVAQLVVQWDPCTLKKEVKTVTLNAGLDIQITWFRKILFQYKLLCFVQSGSSNHPG